MIKRLRALSLAVCFLFVSIFPVRQANAVIPLLVGLAVQGIGAGGTVVAADLFASGVTALIGGTIVALAITPTELANGESPLVARIPTIDDPSAVNAAMPPPAAPATGVIKPPVTTDAVLWQFSNYRQGYSSEGECDGAASAAALANCYAWNPGNPTCANTATSGYCSSYPATVTSDASCGAGYTITGGGCYLTNPRAAISDGKHDYVRSASGFSSAAGEADSSPGYLTKGGGSSGGVEGRLYASGKNSKGEPVMIEYAVSPDGTKTYVTHYTQSDVNGQAVVKSQAISIDASTGAVVGANAATAQGTLTGIGAGSVPVVQTGAISSPLDIVFPTDYARTGEAAGAANVVNIAANANAGKIVTAIEAGFKVDDATLDDPESKTESDFTDQFFPSTFAPLLSWTVPGHASECPIADLSFNMFGHYTPLVLDAHCSIFESVRSVLSATMIVVWVVVAMFIVLGA